MSDVKWTPGPWNINADGVVVGDIKGFCPFNGCGCCGSPWMEGENKEQEIANAHLIAAAPELYEALVDAIDDLEQVFKMCHGYVDTNDLARYKNALAKARGES